MQLIKVEDLKLLLEKRYEANHSISSGELGVLLDYYGDSWYIEGNEFKLTTKNEKMKEFREKYAVRK